MVTSVYANQAVSDAQVYQLLDKSGVTRTIEGLPMQMQAIGQQMALTAKDPSEHQKFMAVFSSSVNTDQMLQEMRDSIKSNVSNDEIANILTWLDSELATRIVQAELQSAQPDFQQNLMRYLAELQTNPPSPERTKAIINYVESADVVEQSMNMIMGMVEVMFEGLKANQPENTELAANLDNQIEQMAKAMKPGLEQQMILTSYFIYQNISDEDLSKYSEFYQQPVGKKYLSLLVNAMTQAMGNWGKSLINEIESAQAAKDS